MPKNNIPSFDSRLQRYNESLSNKRLWDSEVRQAYKFMAPNRNIMSTEGSSSASATNISDKGENRLKDIYDSTGIESVSSFANNIQTTLMPIYQRWATYEPVENAMELGNQPEFVSHFGNITKESLDDLRDQIQKNMETLFKYFDSSNLYQVTNEMLHDLAIGTGAMLVQEGDTGCPLKFSSIPINQVVILDDPSQPVESIARDIKIPVSLIEKTWPDAEIPSGIRSQIESNPNSSINLKEAIWHYPDNDDGFKYYLSVWTNDKEEIVKRYLDKSEWLVPRFSKSPGEVYGRGPALTALPFVRVLNKFTEYFLRGAQWQVSPAFIANNIGDINPYTLQIEPGSVIPVQSQLGSQAGLTPIDFGGNFDFNFKFIQESRQTIKEIMFANPLPPASMPSQTATEVTIRQNNWVQQNAGTFPRLVSEFLEGLIQKSLAILEKKGIINPLKLNGVPIITDSGSPLLKMTFVSPLANIQKQNDLQAINLGIQWAVSTFGGIEGLLSMNIEKLPSEVYQLLDIPQELINEDFEDSPFIHQIKGIINQDPAQQQPIDQGQIVGESPEAEITQQVIPQNIG